MPPREEGEEERMEEVRGDSLEEWRSKGGGGDEEKEEGVEESPFSCCDPLNLTPGKASLSSSSSSISSLLFPRGGWRTR